MSLPGANPAAALKKIGEELQEKFDDAGMGSVEEFVDKLDDLVDQIKKGPAEMVAKAKAQAESLKAQLSKIIEDPSSALPKGGACVTMCASAYANSIKSKLTVVANESQTMAGNMQALVGNVTEPLKQVGSTLDSALQQMEDSVKALAKLPKLVQKEIQGKDSADDVAKVNTGAMKKALKGGDIDGPLTKIQGLAAELAKVVGFISKGVGELAEFVGTASSKISAAFSAPFPLCCLDSQRPQAMQDLLAMVKTLGEINLDPVLNTLQNAEQKISAIKVEVLKTPMEKFQSSAEELIEKLDKTVQAAKLTSGGGMGGMAGKLGFGK